MMSRSQGSEEKDMFICNGFDSLICTVSRNAETIKKQCNNVNWYVSEITCTNLQLAEARITNGSNRVTKCLPGGRQAMI